MNKQFWKPVRNTSPKDPFEVSAVRHGGVFHEFVSSTGVHRTTVTFANEDELKRAQPEMAKEWGVTLDQVESYPGKFVGKKFVYSLIHD